MFCLPKTAWPPTCVLEFSEEDQMKKLATVFVAIVALAFAACAKKATPEG